MSMESNSSKKGIASALAAAVAAVMVFFLAQTMALAQDYPNKPIKLIVPWPAGGITDSGARIFAHHLSLRFQKPVVVENKPGATGMIGAAFVAQSTPDGYTLLLASAETHGINVHTYSKLTYDPDKDFIPIAPFVINPFSIVVRPDFPAATIKELIDLSKANPGKFSYASSGLGSGSQLAMETFRMLANVDYLHIPYQGEAPALVAFMGAQTDVQILSAGRATALRKAGKVKVLAVMTTERYFDLPDIPTLKESGFDKANIANWFGLMAPAKTPAAIVQRLYVESQAVVKSLEARTAFRGIGVEVYPPATRQEFQQFLEDEKNGWGAVIRRANIKPEGK